MSAIARQECVRFAGPRAPRRIDRQLCSTVLALEAGAALNQKTFAKRRETGGE
jgi:hypothetical protein